MIKTVRHDFLRFVLAFSLLTIFSCLTSSQVEKPSPEQQDREQKLQELLSALQILDSQARGLRTTFARVRAETEIADSLWVLDESRAKELLIENFKLTFPEKEPNTSISKGKVRSHIPSSTELAARDLRKRILEIASRDRNFVADLLKLQQEISDGLETHLAAASLAKQALDAGDQDTASQYIRSALQADPTEAPAGQVLKLLAQKDRAGADKIIVEYIGLLRSKPSWSFDEMGRVYFVLLQLMFPSLSGDQKVPPPGGSVMREFAFFVIETVTRFEQSGADLRRFRPMLLTSYAAIQRDAPDLMPAFTRLELKSRSESDSAAIPTMEATLKASRTSNEKTLNDTLENGYVDTPTIEAACRRNEFDKARKAVDRLPDAERRKQFFELIDTREAIALANMRRMSRAEALALKLGDASRIIEAYSILIPKADKDNAHKVFLAYRALDQLRKATAIPLPLPSGVPTQLTPSASVNDLRLSALNKLFFLAGSLDDELMQAILQETIQAINRTEVDSGQGRLGFDANVFKQVMSKDQVQAEQAANALTDPLRRIVALAVIIKCKIESIPLEGKSQANKTKVETENRAQRP